MLPVKWGRDRARSRGAAVRIRRGLSRYGSERLEHTVCRSPNPAGGTFLYQASDGGANWKWNIRGRFCDALVIDPANPAALYGGTAYGGTAQRPERHSRHVQDHRWRCDLVRDQ